MKRENTVTCFCAWTVSRKTLHAPRMVSAVLTKDYSVYMEDVRLEPLRVPRVRAG